MKRRTKNLLLAVPVLVLAGYAAALVGLGFGFPQQPRIPVSPDDSTTEVMGARIRYRTIDGSGPPILLVHGNNLSINDWEPMMQHLQGRRIVALDLVGYAGSDRPPGLKYDIECQRQYLIEFINQLELPPPILVGHSMGGAVVAWTAAKSGDRLAAAAIIAPPGVPGSLVYRWPKSWLCQPGLANRIGFAIADTDLFRSVFPDTLTPQGLGVTGSYSQEYADALRDIKVPTLLVWSPGDTRCLISYAKVYQERIANLEFVPVLDNVGHMVPMSDPAGTAKILASFVDRLDKTAHVP